MGGNDAWGFSSNLPAHLQDVFETETCWFDVIPKPDDRTVGVHSEEQCALATPRHGFHPFAVDYPVVSSPIESLLACCAVLTVKLLSQYREEAALNHRARGGVDRRRETKISHVFVCPLEIGQLDCTTTGVG